MNQCLVQLRDRLEVERIETFLGRELRRPDAPVNQPLLVIDEFEVGQPQKIFYVILAGLRLKTRLLLVFALEAR